MKTPLHLEPALTRESRFVLFMLTPEGEHIRKRHFMGRCKSESEKGRKIIEGLKKARCPLCGLPGQRHLCRCEASARLSERNHRPGFELHGPLSKLP